VVHLSHIVAAARRDPGLPQGGTTYRSEVLIVEQALRAEGVLAAKWASDGSFGSATVAAYAALQRRYGYRGADADGIPGKASLTRLGAAADRFTVTA
jgi:Putative peptidoglycan binding domain.